MRRPPTQGVARAKPRLAKAEQNGEVSKETLAKLSEEYLRTRNEQMRAKAAVAQMEVERRRGMLIDKRAIRYFEWVTRAGLRDGKLRWRPAALR